MFCGCCSLEKLNISNFTINNFCNVGFMFYECSEELKNDKIKSIPELKLKYDENIN